MMLESSSRGELTGRRYFSAIPTANGASSADATKRRIVEEFLANPPKVVSSPGMDGIDAGSSASGDAASIWRRDLTAARWRGVDGVTRDGGASESMAAESRAMAGRRDSMAAVATRTSRDDDGGAARERREIVYGESATRGWGDVG
uniref:Uncharacterized protein n=1 Tax=Oryza glumipatula TaxID=40148 RepID=A0A0D9YRC1_9ORYZ